jgi:hypothetical protein
MHAAAPFRRWNPLYAVAASFAVEDLDTKPSAHWQCRRLTDGTIIAQPAGRLMPDTVHVKSIEADKVLGPFPDFTGKGRFAVANSYQTPLRILASNGA